MNLSKDIINEWDLGTLSKERKTDVVSRISRVLFQALMVRSLDILSDSEQSELDDLMSQDSTTSEDVLIFLKSKIPTFSVLVKEERESLKRSMQI
ncbi:MAG: hypothetical protein WAX44_02320 [Minisyncoccia bacterium]